MTALYPNDDWLVRSILRAFRIKARDVGLGAPRLAIDGHAYRRRQKNRGKRRRR